MEGAKGKSLLFQERTKIIHEIVTFRVLPPHRIHPDLRMYSADRYPNSVRTGSIFRKCDYADVGK